MGEAKRRKANDPSYGKKSRLLISKEKIEKWCKEAEENLPEGFLPDYGHWYIRNLGLKETRLISHGSFPDGGLLILPGRQEEKLLITTGPTCCASSILTKEQYEEHFKGKEKNITSVALVVKPSPENRHKSISGELVIPLIVQSVLSVSTE